MISLYDFGKNHVRVTEVTDIRETHIQRLALKKYQMEVQKGRLNGVFNGDAWTMRTEAKSPVTVRFDRDRDRLIKDLGEDGYNEFIRDIKTFILLLFGTRSQKLLAEFVRCILTERAESSFEAGKKPVSVKWKSSPILHLMDFCKLTPWGSPEYIKECGQVYNAVCTSEKVKRDDLKHPCIMNEFVSYFDFDHIIKKVWNEVMPLQERRYYFPLYLFWRITTVLPMRVTEFCMTPYDCLSMKGEKYYLTIRRTRLKGNPDDDIRIVTYTLEKDYEMETYEIPQSLYEAIETWRQETKDFKHPYDLLFSLDYTKSIGFRNRFSRREDRCFDSSYLNVLLGEFYEDYVIGYAGRRLVTEEDLMTRYLDKADGSYQMYPGEIMKLHLRDTRHLAMINLIRWGCNPMIIRKFAGHFSSKMDEHYYGNVSRMIRCRVRMFFEKAQQAANSINVEDAMDLGNNMQVFIDPDGPHIKVDLGDCHSENRMRKIFKDCEAVNGDCSKCEFLWPDKKGKREDLKGEAKKIDDEVLFVIKMLQSDKGEKMIEQVQRDILNLQTDLRAFLIKTIREYDEKYNRK